MNMLPNIPPFWSALAYWLACLQYMALLPRRWDNWRGGVFAAAHFAVLAAYMTLTAGWQGWVFNLGMVGTAALTAVPFFALCRHSWRNALYYSARAFILGGFTASLSWQLYALLVLPHVQHLALLWQAAVMLPLYALLYLAMYAIERVHRTEMWELDISTATCLTAVCIALVIYIVSSSSYMSIDTPFAGTTDADAFNVRTFAYLGGVAILCAYHLQTCEEHARQEVTALQNILQTQYANYRSSEESVELINRKYHDLKHQIAVLRSEVKSGKNLEYLDRVEQEIHAYEAENKTGNRVLDTILTSKSLHCQQNGIQLTCVADGAALDFMDVMDLSALFGNALDNAIEGVSLLPDADQRLIHLAVARQKGFVSIRLENRCKEELRVDKGLPSTTKVEKGLHGYGLKSIQATVAKYGGSATVHAENGWFELRILIPAMNV